MGWKECTSDRTKTCGREEDQGHNKCTENKDEGYNACTQTRDDGYRDCCSWWPCSWACKAWVWVSHIVCVVWTWVSNIVCVAWTWIKNIVCVVWVYGTAVICLIPFVGKLIIGFLDFALRLILDLIGSVVGGVVDFVTHPIASIGTIISLFKGCPSTKASQTGPLQIIAHHGSTLELPENTLDSCKRALDLGANALEVDVCVTADEELILWHDWDPDDLIALTRQTELAQTDNAFKPHVPLIGDQWRKPTIELTLAEMRDHFTYEDERDALAKVKWQIDHGDVDLKIPTLEEFFLSAARWRTLTVVYLDIKMPASSAERYGGILTDKIHAEVSEIGFTVVVMVPDSVVLKVMKARSDEKKYNLNFTWDVEFPAGLILNPSSYSAIDHATTSLFHNSVASVGRPVASIFPWRVYRRTIDYDIGRWNRVNSDPSRFNAGVKINALVAWTINNKDEMQCLIKMGVTGIITDQIKDLVDAAKAAGR
jgi:glycerophosphoryl diester phosphodiesterase